MSDQLALGYRIRSARLKRGWSRYQMSKRMEGVSQTSIRNIEGLNAQRETHGLDVSLRTALEICTVLWPDVHIQDFCGLDRQSLLRLVPLNQKAKKEIASLQAII